MTSPLDAGGPPRAPLHGYPDPDAPRPPRPGAYPPPRSSPPPSAPPEPAPSPVAVPPRPAPASRGGRDRAPVRGGPRRLNEPRAAQVRAGEGGRPVSIDGHAVDAIRESWLIEDRWWTDAPLRRRYWEVVTVDGRCWVVFRELEGGAWYRQR